jgi:hypothetical protein
LRHDVVARSQRVLQRSDEETRKQRHDRRQQEDQVVDKRGSRVVDRSGGVGNVRHARRAVAIEDEGDGVERQQADRDGTDVNYCLKIRGFNEDLVEFPGTFRLTQVRTSMAKWHSIVMRQADTMVDPNCQMPTSDPS